MIEWVMLAWLIGANVPPEVAGRYDSEHDCWMAQSLANKYGPEDHQFTCMVAGPNMAHWRDWRPEPPLGK
jgi:hypothetical protein